MQYFLLTVDDNSWPEHLITGIAAINDPSRIVGNRQGNAQLQKALCEFALMKPGDLIFFYYQRSKEINGLYKLTSLPFYDRAPLVPGGFIDRRFAIRIEFQYEIQFPIGLTMEELWMVKDKGEFWSLQQQRGDSAGRHAAIALKRLDGDLLLRMLKEKNVLTDTLSQIANAPHALTPLPYDTRSVGGCLHYEATLQSLILEDFKYQLHEDIFGTYDDVTPFFPTSSQKEIDILLIKNDERQNPLWYQIIELKQRAFTQDELKVLMKYDAWVGSTLCNGVFRSVHTIGIAFTFTQDVLDFVSDRLKYTGRKIRLLKYNYNPSGNPSAGIPYINFTLVN